MNRLSAKLIGIAAQAAIVLMLPGAAASQEVVKVFELAATKGTYTDAFSLRPGAIEVFVEATSGNAAGAKRVSSAWLKINGIAILRPNDFNQNVGYVKRMIDERFLVGGKNAFELELKGSPASKLDVVIVAKYVEDNGFVEWYRDMDFDGYGAGRPLRLPESVPPPPPSPMFQWVRVGGDCNDANPEVYPGNGCPF